MKNKGIKKGNVIIKRLPLRKSIILLLSLTVVAGLTTFIMSSSVISFPQSLDIFVVDNTLQYGHTTLTGVIRSDITSNGSGNFYLILDNDRAVGIDKTNSTLLKKLEGKKVEITGELLEIPDLGLVGLMLPSNIIEK